MNEQWIQEYLKDYPQQSFIEYLKNYPGESENLIGADYEYLNWIIEKAKILSQIKQDTHTKLILSLEDQIILALIKLTQDLDAKYLMLLFDISESTN